MEVGEFILVFEDDEGQEIARLRENTRSRPPVIGDEVPITPKHTNDSRLLGKHRVRLVDLLEDGDPPVLHRRYRVPVCYLRRIRESIQGPAAVTSAATATFIEGSTGSLSVFAGDPSLPTPETVAERYRDLATWLGDLSQEAASAARSDKIDARAWMLTLSERLYELSRTAKEGYSGGLFAKLALPRGKTR